MKKIFPILIPVLIIGGILSMVIYFQIQSASEKAAQYNALKSQNDTLKTKLQGKSYYADSLLAKNKMLYSQKQLTEAMNFRDASVKPLLNVGDRVVLRVDSSEAVISDIIIGGDSYTYYIKYVLLHKDRTTETVSPTMIIPAK